MNSFINTAGTIDCSSRLGIRIKSIQADVSDPAATDISVTLSGVVSGDVYTFNAVSPVVADIKFGKNENVAVTSAGATLNTVAVNYIYY